MQVAQQLTDQSTRMRQQGPRPTRDGAIAPEQSFRLPPAPKRETGCGGVDIVNTAELASWIARSPIDRNASARSTSASSSPTSRQKPPTSSSAWRQ